MTTLTPIRDSLAAALVDARAAMESLPPGTKVDAIQRDLCHGAMEALLLPIAELMDLGVDDEAVQRIFENAISNVIVSHALSLANGDRAVAAQIAVETAGAISDRCEAAAGGGRAAVEIVRPIGRDAGGRA